MMSVMGRMLGAAVLGTAWATTASAAGGAPSRLTCSPAEIFQCESVAECVRITAEAANLPFFFTADLAGKSINGKRPDGSVLETAIQRQVQEGDTLVLQGVEAGRGWSISVDLKSGKAAIGVVSPDVGFMITGACLVEQAGT